MKLRFSLAVVIVLLPCVAFGQRRAPSKGTILRDQKQREAQAKTERDPVWKWPFKQTEKQVGVEYRERSVPVKDAEQREWKALVPGTFGGATISDLEGRVTGVTAQYTGYVEQIVQGKLLAVSEEAILLSIEGRKEPFWQLKVSLRPADARYVKALELKLAKEVGEPAAGGNDENAGGNTDRDAEDADQAAESEWPFSKPVVSVKGESAKQWTIINAKGRKLTMRGRLVSIAKTRITLDVNGKDTQVAGAALSPEDKQYVLSVAKRLAKEAKGDRPDRKTE